MWWLLSKIEDIGLMREIWVYFSVKDILHLMKSDKASRGMSLRLNSVVPAVIVIQTLNNIPLIEMNRNISSLTTFFPIINKISFKDTQFVKDSILYSLYKNKSLINNLEELSARVCHVGLKGISQMINIKHLDLSKSHTLKDIALCELSSLVNLKSLNFTSCSMITGEGFSHITHLTKITTLNLNFCGRNICDEGIFHILPLTNLEDLDLTYSVGLSGTALSSLSHLISMKKLCLSYCGNLSDSALQQILTSMTRLIWLDIKKCTSLTKASISCIAYHQTLEILNIQGIASSVLSNEILILLLSNLKSLKTLLITWTLSLTSVWLSRISESNIVKLYIETKKTKKSIKDENLSIETINYLMQLEGFYITNKFKRVKLVKGLAYVRDSIRDRDGLK